MKITSNPEGGVCLHLSADEITLVLKASKQTELFHETKPVMPNIFRGFHENSVNFFNDLRKNYGMSWIDTQSDLFSKLRHEHKIVSANQSIYILEKRGGVVVEHISRRSKRIKFMW